MKYNKLYSFLLSLLSLTFIFNVDAQSLSPFADKPCVSYSGYKDESGKPATLLWGNAPLNEFG